jgi:phosphatidate cytidylyltransferase
MLKNRVITALWAIPLVILAVWFDAPISWFTLLVAIVGVLGVYEVYRLTGVNKSLPLTVFGLALALLFITRPLFPDKLDMSILLAGAAGLSLITLVFLPKVEGLYTRWAWMLGGALYVGLLLSCFAALRLEPGTAAFPDAGRDFVFLAFLATFGSDTAAYFIGKAIGKHKLAPAISPGKTWEGTVAGLCGAMVIGYLFTLNTPLQLPLNWWQGVLLGLAISVFGQLGDLVESLLKRSFKVKDSGALMPGHGGILDRLDSLLFAGVVMYLWYVYIVL